MTEYMVKWEDYPSHLATQLGALLEHQKLVDVTLLCNTHTLRVHRNILAAGSPYFEGILLRNLSQQPLIVLEDMQFSVLKSLIEFMYCGETSVTEENMPALLQAAKIYQVRGLTVITEEVLALPAERENSALNGVDVAEGVASLLEGDDKLEEAGDGKAEETGEVMTALDAAVAEAVAQMMPIAGLGANSRIVMMNGSGPLVMTTGENGEPDFKAQIVAQIIDDSLEGTTPIRRVVFLMPVGNFMLAEIDEDQYIELELEK